MQCSYSLLINTVLPYALADLMEAPMDGTPATRTFSASDMVASVQGDKRVSVKAVFGGGAVPAMRLKLRPRTATPAQTAAWLAELSDLLLPYDLAHIL